MGLRSPSRTGSPLLRLPATAPKLALALALAGPGAACGRARGGPEKSPPAHAIAFIEDDYPRALAEARSRKVPLFIDAWAPWCHTCLSLRAYVFPDPALGRYAERFVWLSLDTERESNAPVASRLGVEVLPTLFVIDPGSEQPVLRWPGALTAAELSGLLDDAEATAMHRDVRHSAGAALAVDARVSALSDAKRFAECVVAAQAEVPRMPPGTALADVLRSGLGCADQLAPDAPERAHLPALVAVGQRVLADRSQPILADDRSDLYDYVVHALRSLGQAEEATAAAQAWATFLETEAGAASTPRGRAVFDAHRLLAYRALGEPARAIPMLELSERDFPGDYNPPARLAAAYLDLKRYDEALAAAKRALERAYGPRKLRLFSLEADILVARGDIEGARSALREALAFAAATPLPTSYPKLRDAIAKRLADLR